MKNLCLQQWPNVADKIQSTGTWKWVVEKKKIGRWSGKHFCHSSASPFCPKIYGGGLGSGHVASDNSYHIIYMRHTFWFFFSRILIYHIISIIWLWCGSLAILHFGLQWLLQQLVSLSIISLQQLVMAVFMLENLGLWVVTQGLILSILSQKSLRLSGTSILTQFPFIGFMFDGD